ncbi:bifunctional 2',3'-cyclic-nucleotide 2'-phosphodiesterase/3'-nucleotidase [Clostridium septicum]|nr:bifunctional 2',3'-cyclic-nucleotide 2'-phosphodiesterase/3'-nucleotidase [Clostridium septicum]UEC22198.1 bifunctional 2',3'-cyclic-nucleotide 2'-phosphodiesterase/3'-nucleotidase [Clostridium septicum]USR99773.1 bifunctional 2',3'-cyclic-nucleotide 2'-phosphodiesterase/3'-nucleotidase [Clostridium septicum]
MKRKKILAMIVAVQLISTSFILGGCGSTNNNKDKTSVNLRIMATTDMHSNLMDYDYYTDSKTDKLGMVKISTLMKEAKKEVDPNNNLDDEIDNTLVVDNGDDIQGTPLADYYNMVEVTKPGEKSPIYETLEKMNYDIGNIGNHEFNYGLDYLKQLLNDTSLPTVNANVYEVDGTTNVFTPYKIIEEKVMDSAGKEETIKIGVIGFVPPQILNWDKINLDGKVVVKDIKKTAEEFIPKIRKEGADIVIALSHSGYGDGKYEEGKEDEAYELTRIDGIDAVVTGHSHDQFPNKKYEKLGNVDVEKGTMNGIPTVQPLNYAKELGIIDLKLEKDGEKWKVIDGKSEVRAVKGVENDKELVDFLKPYHETILEYINSSVGKIAKDINSYFALVADNEGMQIVTDAQKKYVEKLKENNIEEITKYKDLPILSATAPLKAGLTEGGINPEDYFNLKEGDIKIKDVSNLYKYPNMLAVVKITGADVREWLEMSAGQFNKLDKNNSEAQDLININYPGFNFDIIDGVTYEIDVTEDTKYDKEGNIVNEKANRIKNLSYNGKPIDDNQEFLVITNNYRAGGGGHFPCLKNGDKLIYLAADETRQIISDYIKENSPLPCNKDNNWKLSGDGIKAKFISNENAENYISEYKGITASDSAGEKLKNYIYDLTK